MLSTILSTQQAFIVVFTYPEQVGNFSQCMLKQLPLSIVFLQVMVAAAVMVVVMEDVVVVGGDHEEDEGVAVDMAAAEIQCKYTYLKIFESKTRRLRRRLEITSTSKMMRN